MSTRQIMLLIVLMALTWTTTPILAHEEEPPPQILSPTVRFAHLSTEDGLSHNRVTAILQDSEGFVWIGTEGGLNRYDGYTFTVYHHSSRDPQSLSDNHVTDLYEDAQGRLWVATREGGLNRFDPHTQTFTHYQQDSENPPALMGHFTFFVFQDSRGAVWFGGPPGPTRFDPDTGTFTHYSRRSNTSRKFEGGGVWDVIEDDSGDLWMAADFTLARFDPVGESFAYYAPDTGDGRLVKLLLDDAGAFWVGGELGLYRFDLQTERFEIYQPDLPIVVNDLLLDDEGTLWISTRGDGLYLFDTETRQFTEHYTYNPTYPAGLSGNLVYDVYQDRAGILWIGTDNGLNLYDPRQRQFTHYRQHPGSALDGSVWGLDGDHEGTLWMGAGTMLSQVELATGQVTHYPLGGVTTGSALAPAGVVAWDPEGLVWAGVGSTLYQLDLRSSEVVTFDLQSLQPPGFPPVEIVDFVHEDTQLWMGVLRGGLIRFDLQEKSLTPYPVPPPAEEREVGSPPFLLSHEVTTLSRDRDGVLWIGYATGELSRLPPGEAGQLPDPAKIKHYHPGADNPAGDAVSLGGITGLHQDEDGTLWITSRRGLTRFDPERETFALYIQQESRAGAAVRGMQQDQKGDLWLATTRGISHFDPQTDTFHNYGVADGVGSSEFLGTSWQATDGRIFFGGKDGLTAFYPDQVHDNSYDPPVVLTRLYLFNEEVEVGEGSLLNQPIWETEHLTLQHDQTSIALEFAALNYAAPRQNRYRYILEGIDEAWNEVGSDRRLATYTHLPAGTYTFRAQGTNNSRVWSIDEATLTLTILPPWWETWWFRGTLAALIVGLLLTGVRWRVSALERYSRDLETQVTERTKELHCLYAISQLVETPDITREEFLQGTVALIPPAWHHPEIACARITLEGRTHQTENFSETVRRQSAPIIVQGEQRGAVEVGYLEERTVGNGALFVEEERSLLAAIAERLGEVTERMRAEEQVREQHRFLQTVLDSFAHPFYVIDAGTRVVAMANRAACTPDLDEPVLCHTLTHGQAQPCGGQEHPCPLEEIKRIKRSVIVEHTHIDREGRHQDVEIHGFPIFDEQDNVVQMIEYVVDVTERKRIEAQSQRLVVMEERERIGRELHDDLGQVMGYVSVQSQAALERLGQGEVEQVRAILHQLAQSASEAHDDVRQYILGVRTRAAPPPQNLFAALEDYLGILRERYALIVQVSWPENLLESPLAPEVENQLLRIVQEALTNVRKHAGVDEAQVIFTCHPDGVQVVVADRGAGFDRATALAADGHFGLQIMRERAESVGGSLEIRSAPGAGTRLVIHLPSSLVSAEDTGPVRGLRVLLVDDHPLYLEGLRTLLVSRGIQVIGEAYDGLEAHTQAQALRPDLILMDVQMPHCDGVEATRRIKKELPQIQIVMLTMAADDATLFEALKAGASGYLLKNLDGARFFRLLRQVMDGETVISPALASHVLAEFAQRDEDILEDKMAALTTRQREVLERVAQGLTNKEVAAVLHITERTVKYHVSQILERLQLNSRHQLARYADGG
ncbi:MAG: two-component regulator propeller domain-containing protein [Anaerolineales bacterium]